MSDSPSKASDHILGIDVGGTFTDFVAYDGGQLRIHKVLTMPDAPETAIQRGINDLGWQHKTSRLVHGSTIATNAVLEEKGAKTAFITNRGFRDLLSIGRQARPELYNLTPLPHAPPVRREWCLETGGRLGADGSAIEPLTEADLVRLRDTIERLQPEAVAICLLFSFRDDSNEKAIQARLPPDLFMSRSSEILPEYREYERAITTWLNAYVGPLVQGYLGRLERLLPSASVAIMQSSGGTLSASQAGRRAVHLLLSGPAGGLIGAKAVADNAGYDRILTLDMGGTSTDVAVIDGDIALTSSGHIARYPVAISMVDMHTVGAGGGSLAKVDSGGVLRVGPQSAGADPGPACYGLGGTGATVTDANLVLGRLPQQAKLGGEMSLDRACAVAALKPIAAALGVSSIEDAAEGILKIANEHMARALRVISVQRGLDPRDFALVCFGGAGGLHVCDLADELCMTKALAPIHAGVLSALGMVTAAPSRQLSRTLGGLLDDYRASDIEKAFTSLAENGRSQLRKEGIEPDAIQLVRSLDLCYEGQSYTLNIPWQGNAAAARGRFHREHKAQYGHRLDIPIQLVNLRLGVRSRSSKPEFPRLGRRSPAAHIGLVPVHSAAEPATLWERPGLAAGQIIDGPAIIMEPVSTTYVAPDWRCRVDDYGNLHLCAVHKS